MYILNDETNHLALSYKLEHWGVNMNTFNVSACEIRFQCNNKDFINSTWNSLFSGL